MFFWRCPLSWLMRSLNIATCTSTEPVSVPWVWWLLISSCFWMVSSDMRGVWP